MTISLPPHLSHLYDDAAPEPSETHYHVRLDPGGEVGVAFHKTKLNRLQGFLGGKQAP